MATEQDWRPVDKEIEQLLADNPDLVEELNEFDRAYARGEAELVSDDEVRRVLEARGLKVASRNREEEPDAEGS